MNNLGLILVVDDTFANLEVMSEALEDVGYEVATAIDGIRAIKRVQSHPPDLILLDVQMPGIDGFETCQRLKSDPNTASIPVIFMTALTDTDSKVKGFSVGAVDYITKPFQTEEVLARVNTHLQLRYLTQHLENSVAERTATLQIAMEELHKKSQKLEQTLQELQQAQLQIVQSEKMSALGNLVAGVAHEINNPVGCIIGNVNAAQDYINDLLNIIDLYAKNTPQLDPEIAEEIETFDLDYLREDLPKLMTAMQDGSNRIKSISNSLSIFSRADSDCQQFFDIHAGINSTMLILGHRLKANQNRPDIKVITDYGNLPEIQCFPGQLNQVFMNILANAIDGLDESNEGRSFAEIKADPNCITIQTSLENEQVIIAISDNGKGIPEEIKNHVFDYLFTTKSVGKGTGLGLAIARQIVEDKHGGKLQMRSEVEEGTTFEIILFL